MDKSVKSPVFRMIILDLDDTILATTRWVTNMQAGLIKPFDGMESVLRNLAVPYHVVTAGDVFTQTSKVNQAGLGYLQLYCCDPVDNAKEKSEVFRSILGQADLDPRQVLVIGDKITQEICYGNMIGCTTVRTKFGGRQDDVMPTHYLCVAKFTVESPEELIQLLGDLNMLKGANND